MPREASSQSLDADGRKKRWTGSLLQGQPQVPMFVTSDGQLYRPAGAQNSSQGAQAPSVSQHGTRPSAMSPPVQHPQSQQQAQGFVVVRHPGHISTSAPYFPHSHVAQRRGSRAMTPPPQMMYPQQSQAVPQAQNPHPNIHVVGQSPPAQLPPGSNIPSQHPQHAQHLQHLQHSANHKISPEASAYGGSAPPMSGSIPPQQPQHPPSSSEIRVTSPVPPQPGAGSGYLFLSPATPASPATTAQSHISQPQPRAQSPAHPAHQQGRGVHSAQSGLSTPSPGPLSTPSPGTLSATSPGALSTPSPGSLAAQTREHQPPVRSESPAARSRRPGDPGNGSTGGRIPLPSPGNMRPHSPSGRQGFVPQAQGIQGLSSPAAQVHNLHGIQQHYPDQHRGPGPTSFPPGFIGGQAPRSN